MTATLALPAPPELAPLPAGSRTTRRAIESRATLSDYRAGIQETKMSRNGSKTHRLWYADSGRKAKRDIVVYARSEHGTKR